MNKSDSIAALAAALSKAQGEFDAVPFNTTNKFLNSRYADLGAVIEAAKPIIANHGLAVAQLTEDAPEDAIGITTILMHSSGEWLSSFVSLPLGEEKGKSRAQVAGSIISYLRRYAYASILGLYAEEETDGSTDPHQTVERRRDQEKGATVAETTKGRPTAQQMRDKAKEQVISDAMPDEPGQIAAWFNAAVAAQPAETLDPAGKEAGIRAQKLGQMFREVKIGDQNRRLIYLALTGKEHGADLTPQQMRAMKLAADEPEKLLRLARWYTERNSQATPPEMGG